MNYVAYTDGASRKDGRGGWGYVLYLNDQELETACGGHHETTNNRMELLAAIKALEGAKPFTDTLTVISDSIYVVAGITDHMDSWLRSGWRGTGNQEIKNKDLWERLGHLDCDYKKVAWQWVKGHTGIIGNERADELAGLGVPEK